METKTKGNSAWAAFERQTNATVAEVVALGELAARLADDETDERLALELADLRESTTRLASALTEMLHAIGQQVLPLIDNDRWN